MNRAEFIERLRIGLKGLEIDVVSEIIADYESYFDEGARAGRSDAQTSAALGDPARVAAELSLATHSAEWNQVPTRRGAARTLASVIALLAFDGFLLLPFGIALLVLGAGFIAATIYLLYGFVTVIVGPFDAPVGGPLAAVLRGVGLLAGGVAGLAIVTLLARLLVDVSTRRARPYFHSLHRSKHSREST